MSPRQSLFTNLNAEQAEAVRTTDGPLLIIAGAGSGKTRVITHRIAHMIAGGVPPGSILALTFTNKAAAEMAERVRSLTGYAASPWRAKRRESDTPTISTFHAFGLSILRRSGKRLGYRPNFTVYDTADQLALLKESARDIDIHPDDVDLYAALSLFSALKTRRTTWNDPLVAEIAVPGGRDALERLFYSYTDHLRVYNAVDFDDLIVRPIALLQDTPDVRSDYNRRYTHVLVDEFQDTSTMQYELLHLIAASHRNICVVGDDDQSIYSWRGADVGNFARFESDFPGVREIRLERNYRSTGPILAAANSVIENNLARKEKRLWTAEPEGAELDLIFAANEEEEATFIADTIKLMHYRDQLPYDSFGILVRTNGQTRPIEEALLGADLPYRVSGGQSFFQRKEIRDVAAYLRVIINPDDDVNMLRIVNTPRRGVGRRSLEHLQELATPKRQSLFSTAQQIRHGTLAHRLPASAAGGLGELLETIEEYAEHFRDGRDIADTVERLIHRIGYWPFLIGEYQRNERAAKAKWRNIALFVRTIRRYEENPDVIDPSLTGFINRISLQSRDAGDGDDRERSVQLMTIHAAKGLEHDTVFLAGVEDGIIPHRRSVEESGSDEEERRLFYVALTRARRRLFVSSCRQRMVNREIVESAPSPFLQEIPEDVTVVREADASADRELPEDPFSAMKALMSD